MELKSVRNSRSASTNFPLKPTTEWQAAGAEVDARPAIPILDIDKVKGAFAEKLIGKRPRDKRSSLSIIDRIAQNDLPDAIEQLQRNMTQDELLATSTFVRISGALISPQSHDFPDEAATPLSKDIQHVWDCMQAAVAEHHGTGPDSEQERRCLLIDCLGKIFRNEFSSDAGRWAANVANVSLRTGLTVAVCTLMRDAVAFAVARAAHHVGQDVSLHNAGILAIAIGPTLNLLGGIVSGATGTANLTSVTCRLLMGVANLGVILACYEMGVLDAFGLDLAAYVCYCAARDTCNFFFPLTDNLRSMPVRGVVGSGAIYGLFQWVGGMAIGVAAPLAGAHALPRATGNETVPWERVAATPFHLVDSGTHGSLNALLEIGDDLIMPAIAKHLENKAYLFKEARNIRDEAVHAQYLGELSDFAKQLLKTPSEQRQKMIDEKNHELYQREVQRMTSLSPDELDEAHQQYLETASNWLHLYELTQQVAQILDESLPLGSLNSVQLYELSQLEKKCGVYKSTRELARIELLQNPVSQHTEDERKYLNDLRKKVKPHWEELQELEKQNLGVLDKSSKRRAYLRRELEEKPLRLPPMSSLLSDAQTTPDFTHFDRSIAKELRRWYSTLIKEKADRQKVIEEVFVYQFIKAFLPLPILTPVELKKLKDIDETLPNILSSERMPTMATQVTEQRSQDIAGLCIQLKTRSCDELINALAGTVLTTDAARQTLFATVVGTLYALSFLIEDSDEDAQLAIGNLIAGMTAFLLYSLLYLMHMQGASPKRPIERPGAQSGVPPLSEPEKTEGLLTPRDWPLGSARDPRGLSEVSESLTASEDDSELELKEVQILSE